jgi:hypothetical protein
MTTIVVRVERTELVEALRTARVVQEETTDDERQASKAEEESLTPEEHGSWRSRVISRVRGSKSDANHPQSLRGRLTETDIAELITAYRDGATAASLAATHGVSLRSVKRLLNNAGIRRTPPTRGPATTTPVATNR